MSSKQVVQDLFAVIDRVREAAAAGMPEAQRRLELAMRGAGAAIVHRFNGHLDRFGASLRLSSRELGPHAAEAARSAGRPRKFLLELQGIPELVEDGNRIEFEAGDNDRLFVTSFVEGQLFHRGIEPASGLTEGRLATLVELMLRQVATVQTRKHLRR